MRRAILMLLAVLAVGCGESAAQQEPMTVYGVGGLTCGNWLSTRDEGNEVQQSLYLQWVTGWIISYNYYVTETPQPRVRIVDFETIAAFLDAFCRDRRSTNVIYGAAELVEKLGGGKALHNRPAPQKQTRPANRAVNERRSGHPI